MTTGAGQQAVGTHTGGYGPFSFDITDALPPADAGTDPERELLVAVRDPTDRGPQPRGKPVLAPESIWYTAVTGIWRTVWLEPVPAERIAALANHPSIVMWVPFNEGAGASTTLRPRSRG